MKFLLHTLLVCFCLLTTFIYSSDEIKDIYPSLDLNFPTILPKNFRMPTDPFKEKADRLPTRMGLENLRASASGQFLNTSLVLMLNKLPQDKKVIVIDLREESHGYVNSWPIAWRLENSTWTNMGRTLEQIEQDESLRLAKIKQDKKVILDPYSKSMELNIWSATTEKELLKNFNLDYLRLPITENHAPTPACVDQIVELIRTLPADKWLHIHCHGGRGRTTTFLVMYDIMLNGHKVSLEDIMLRQKLLGGSDILKEPVYHDYRHVPLEARLLFLKKFYEYATKNDLSKVKYSTWLKNQNSQQVSQRLSEA